MADGGRVGARRFAFFVKRKLAIIAHMLLKTCNEDSRQGAQYRIDLKIYMEVYLQIYQGIYMQIYLQTYLRIYLQIYRQQYLQIYMQIHRQKCAQLYMEMCVQIYIYI